MTLTLPLREVFLYWVPIALVVWFFALCAWGEDGSPAVLLPILAGLVWLICLIGYGLSQLTVVFV